jgi:hypothetical protein
VTGDEKLADEVGKKLNELYIRRLTFESYELQQVQMVDTKKETQTTTGDSTTLQQN